MNDPSSVKTVNICNQCISMPHTDLCETIKLDVKRLGHILLCTNTKRGVHAAMLVNYTESKR